MVAAWLGGTYIGLNTDSHILPLLLLFLAALAGGPLFRLYRLSLWPIVLAAVLLLALLRVEATDRPLPQLASEDEQPVTVRGKISNDPEATPQLIKFTLDVEAIDRGDGLVPFDATVLVLSQLGFGNCLRKRLRLLPFFRSVDVGGWQPWDENGMWSGWKGKNETSWND